MPVFRLIYRYHFKVDGEIVRTGITSDIDIREWELRKEPGWSGGKMQQVGFRMTYKDARAWERKQAAEGMPVEASVAAKA